MLGLAPVLGGCYVRPEPVYVTPAPQPPPVYEAPPPDPAPQPYAEQPPPPPPEQPPAYVQQPAYAEAPPPPPSPMEPSVYPTSPPPDPIPEYQPPAPGYGYYWVSGYWDWNGYDWDWNAGYWVPQRPGFIYIGPRFVWESGRPVYYRSYWQGPNGYREYGYAGSRAPTTWRARPS
ncbi:MAG TPA: hypothetical protein VHM31_13015, partial [Polyangia bacterium]|nr:hypothetical protein [Polyangia bacterium]